jgi:DNA-binding transcriptional MerR regulator
MNDRGRDEVLQEFFSIGDVCELTDLKPHVLRYWESQFRFLSPAKNRSGNRVYQRREVELIQLVKHLLYTEKYTIDGARQKVEEHRKGGMIRVAAREALAVETLAELERELQRLVDVLDGSATIPRSESEGTHEERA